jgi:hypothetical protein
MRQVLDGRESEVTFDEFPYYLRQDNVFLFSGHFDDFYHVVGCIIWSVLFLLIWAF